MQNEVIVLAVHGMGDTRADFADELRDRLADRVGDAWNRVYFDSIYYQGVFQDNEERVMREMRKSELDSIRLRKFVLYGFSDVTAMERQPENANRPYHQVQEIIRDTLSRAHDAIGGPRPVILIAQSLGGQVISNYLWDAQKRGPKRGVWKSPGSSRGTRLDRFLRLKDLRYFYTTGCNIPIFLAGYPEEEIIAVKHQSMGYSFQWKNFYDEDDVLGWPLKPLSRSYGRTVSEDRAINANGSFFGNFTHGWNVLSHTRYWMDSDVLEPLAEDVLGLLSRSGPAA